MFNHIFFCDHRRWEIMKKKVNFLLVKPRFFFFNNNNHNNHKHTIKFFVQFIKASRRL